MCLFGKLGDLNYEDVIQLDGAFSMVHEYYGKSPSFYTMNDTVPNHAIEKMTMLVIKDTDYDLSNAFCSFDGTWNGYSKDEKIVMWKTYWLEYINAFDKMTATLPDSVATAYIGRQTVEMGFKYLSLIKTGSFECSHDLGILAKSVFKSYTLDKGYWKYVDEFCIKYGEYIEGGHPEYFKYPDYKGNSYFAGVHLDISWILYNLAIIVLKQLHLAEIDINEL